MAKQVRVSVNGFFNKSVNFALAASLMVASAAAFAAPFSAMSVTPECATRDGADDCIPHSPQKSVTTECATRDGADDCIPHAGAY